jgi:hypothetical protein
MQVLVLQPLLLMLCRFGQGIGLGGEWGGVPVKMQPAKKDGMFPQLGAQLVCCYQEELLVLGPHE